MIKALIFDWGDTVMRDFPEYEGPMAEWVNVECIPFIEDALKNLYTNYFICIASNAGYSDSVMMRKALERVGVDKYFHYFFTSKDLGYEKPEKRFFQKIADEINLFPFECVMIGNSYEKDIIGAKATGMKTILFNEKKFAGDYIDADEVIDSMKKLPLIIKNFI
jgi:putative hydrolase of the HAD superfamily